MPITPTFVPGLGGTSADLWVPATAFSNNFGSPTLNATAGLPAWLLDAAGTEVIVAAVDIPEDWTTFDVDLWWTNAASGGAGNVVLNFRYSWIQDGDTLNAGLTNLGNVTLTAPAPLVTEVTAMASTLTPTAGKKFRIDFRRSGGDAADTLANDVAILGFVVRPTP